jgi:NADP-dependent aldehyde dehydrogenase
MIEDTRPEKLDRVLRAAAEAAAPLAALSLPERAEVLRAAATVLDGSAADLVSLARTETALPEQRLISEVARTTGQLRLFADEVQDGGFLEVVIDTADPGAFPLPRPDLRRMLVPVGPVLVFAAGNFPFAFSVAGGDTASALAAGAPVVVKAHPGHPELSRRTGELVSAAVHEAGAPVGSFAVIHGVDAGVDALSDRRVKAASFTGSVRGGRALLEVVHARPDPIPFYGELGSLNPVVVTRAAVADRGPDIVHGFVQSFTLGTGQFCTKPGLLFLPVGHGLDDAITSAVAAITPGDMLNRTIEEGHRDERDRLLSVPGMRTVVTTPDDGTRIGATVAATTAETVVERPEEILRECFGPTSVVVEYQGSEDLLGAVRSLEGTLTATVHAGQGEDLGEVLERLAAIAGRVVFDGWPTGVAVTPAMHHGGPWPATTASLHTSVGSTAVRRFLRPLCFQNAPRGVLPAALRDINELGIPRRVDGVPTREDVCVGGD